MSSAISGEYSNIAIITIVLSWTFTLLAFLSLLLLFYARHTLAIILGADDIVLIVAFVLIVLLVSQTTWAIVDEGQGRHITDVSTKQISLVARV